MKVYTKIAGKLSMFRVDNVTSHVEAINMVVDELHKTLTTSELLQRVPVLVLLENK